MGIFLGETKKPAGGLFRFGQKFPAGCMAKIMGKRRKGNPHSHPVDSRGMRASEITVGFSRKMQYKTKGSVSKKDPEKIAKIPVYTDRDDIHTPPFYWIYLTISGQSLSRESFLDKRGEKRILYSIEILLKGECDVEPVSPSLSKKKILLVFASPHPEGCTRRLTDAFLSPLMDSGHYEVEEVPLYPLMPHPCVACGVCRKKNGCRFSDLDTFDAALRESDLLVIASPVYTLSFPAPMKALLDRCQRYFEARFARGEKPSIPKHRPAVLLLTRGSADSRGDEICRMQLSQSFSVMNTALVDTCVWEQTDQGEKFFGPAAQKARTVALAIDKLLW